MTNMNATPINMRMATKAAHFPGSTADESAGETTGASVAMVAGVLLIQIGERVIQLHHFDQLPDGQTLMIVGAHDAGGPELAPFAGPTIETLLETDTQHLLEMLH